MRNIISSRCKAWHSGALMQATEATAGKGLNKMPGLLMHPCNLERTINNEPPAYSAGEKIVSWVVGLWKGSDLGASL